MNEIPKTIVVFGRRLKVKDSETDSKLYSYFEVLLPRIRGAVWTDLFVSYHHGNRKYRAHLSGLYGDEADNFKLAVRSLETIMLRVFKAHGKLLGYVVED
jgi:hypothetical protein